MPVISTAARSSPATPVSTHHLPDGLIVRERSSLPAPAKRTWLMAGRAFQATPRIRQEDFHQSEQICTKFTGQWLLTVRDAEEHSYFHSGLLGKAEHLHS